MYNHKGLVPRRKVWTAPQASGVAVVRSGGPIYRDVQSHASYILYSCTPRVHYPLIRSFFPALCLDFRSYKVRSSNL